MSDDLTYRSEFLLDVFKRHNIPKDASILEIGCGDNRNIRYLQNAGYSNVTGIDSIYGTAIEDVYPENYDVIFTMSCLFLIPEDKTFVFEKIADMATKYLITIEGETTKGTVVGRNYGDIFTKLDFEEIEHQSDVFNQFGHLRVFKKK